MDNAVREILDGNFTREAGSLSFSEPLIELKLYEGERHEGSFTVFGPEGQYTEGRIFTAEPHLNIPVDTFSGERALIYYVADATGMIPGDSLRGEFRVVSNQGEYLIPYDIRVISGAAEAPEGNIRNLFQFINLAKTDFENASEIFFSDEFPNLLTGEGEGVRSLYRVLSHGRDKKQSLEEFLLGIKKKQPVAFILREKEIRIDHLSWENGRNVIINRNGWGYSELTAGTDAPFIELSGKSLTERDFEGNTAILHFDIKEKELHNGRNFGRITISNPYQELSVTVIVHVRPLNRRLRDVYLVNKHLTVDLMSYYEAFRTRRISSSTWLKKTGEVVDELMEHEPERLSYKLMHAQLLLTGGRANEAAWILDQEKPRIGETEDPAVYCYYYYLLTLLNRSDEDIDQVCAMVREIYERDRSNWRVAWLLLYLNEEYVNSPARRWEFLHGLTEHHAASPVIYAEGAQILMGNPTVLTQLGTFEMRLLRYMVKKDILTPAVAEQLVYLLGRQKGNSKSAYPLLARCYELLGSDEVLMAVCTLLINLNVTEPYAFPWYEKAVDKGLRITRLYEYYLLSIDPEGSVSIPKRVLMYFAFDSSLPVFRNSFLYAYVCKNKALYPEICQSYSEDIREFVKKQAAEGANNRFLASLYREYITEDLTDEKMASGLMKAAFLHELRPRRKGIRRVIVSYDSLNGEFAYPAKDGFVPVYGSNNHIILEDEEGRYFVRKEEYTDIRLMTPDKIAGIAAPLLPDEEVVLYDLYLAEKGTEAFAVTETNADSMKRLAACPYLSEKLRKDIGFRLASFFYGNDRMSDLDALLSGITPEQVPAVGIPEMIGYMIRRGMDDKAYEWTDHCILSNIDPKALLRLVTRMLTKPAHRKLTDAPDEKLLLLCYVSFLHGRINRDTAEYLVKHFRGTSAEMFKVMGEAKDLGVDTSPLMERLLLQLLKTGAYLPEGTEIFARYAEEGKDRDLLLAYDAKLCFSYFVRGREPDPAIFPVIEKASAEGREIPLVCKLAYTKYYADRIGELTNDERKNVMVFLKDLLAKELYFPYFRRYSDTFIFMHRFLDKTMVEYRLHNGTRAVINYVLHTEDADREAYQREEMREMYYGICVKAFVLFYGEKIRYYITEDEGEGELRESGELTCQSSSPREGNSKYGMLNDIGVAAALGDEENLRKLLRQYYQYDHLLRNLFHAER